MNGETLAELGRIGSVAPCQYHVGSHSLLWRFIFAKSEKVVSQSLEAKEFNLTGDHRLHLRESKPHHYLNFELTSQALANPPQFGALTQPIFILAPVLAPVRASATVRLERQVRLVWLVAKRLTKRPLKPIAVVARAVALATFAKFVLPWLSNLFPFFLKLCVFSNVLSPAFSSGFHVHSFL